MQRKTFHYSGHVQGVGFRYTVQHLAQRYRVTGYVRNLSDGRVELVCEGPEDQIEQLAGDVAESMRSFIRDVQVNTSTATGEFEGFSIRY